MGTHSCVIAPHLKDSLFTAEADGNKYGRMFPGLAGLDVDETFLLALGRAGSIMDAASRQADKDGQSDNPRIPAGFAFFGQFIAHDITADRSLLLHHASLNKLRNFRTPRLDLECLYGAGPTGNPYLYDLDDPDKFLLGLNDLGKPDDLPRNRQGVALLGDQRNDVHLFVSQLHVAFLKFHNSIVDSLRNQGVQKSDVFQEAQRLVRWHYQWIVVHEFLPLSASEELVSNILNDGPTFYTYDMAPFIPIEFADAAYRFGHSQIRTTYKLNSSGAGGRVFPECAGTCPVPHERVIDWTYFFDLDNQRPPQTSRRIDTVLAHSLMELPASVVGATAIPEQHSLAYRDLERGEALSLPSGEAIARAMNVEPLSKDEVGLKELGWTGETPLWFYILKEAEVRNGGEHLGDVGGRIVAEVLLSLIDADANSYRNADTDWKPTLPGIQEGDFTMADLLRFAHAA